jgi:hypothetical protein
MKIERADALLSVSALNSRKPQRDAEGFDGLRRGA